MPFQSEKQRRYLWLKHPDIAKRWAHEYPKQDKLPMYATDSKNKENDDKDGKHSKIKAGCLRILSSWRTNKRASVASWSAAGLQNKAETAGLASADAALITKKSNSILEYVNVPHSEKPTAAGDEHVTIKRDAEKAKKRVHCERLFGFHDSDEMKKLSRVFRGNKEFVLACEKLAADIRLGREHFKNFQDSSSAPTSMAAPGFNNVGLDYSKILGQIAQMKQQRAWAFQQAMMFPPAGSDKKQPAPAPVAAYPGMNSAPGNQPQNQAASVAANKPAMQSPTTNIVGTAGPLTTKNGIPTVAQNLNGNAAFGKNIS